MPNFPTSLDALANPTATTLRNDPGFELHQAISTLNDIVEALEAKLGTGASVPGSPAAVLRRTANGASGWGPVAAGDLAAGAAGMTKLGEMAGNGVATALEISGIPGTYRRLLVQVVGRATVAGSQNMLLTFETTPTAAFYYHQRLYGTGATAGANENLGAQNAITAGATPSVTASANLHSSCSISLPEYAAAVMKPVEITAASLTGPTTGLLLSDHIVGFWASTAPITLVRVTLAASGIWSTTSRLTLWGYAA